MDRSAFRGALWVLGPGLIVMLALLLQGHYPGGRQAGPIVARLGAVRERIPELGLPEDAIASILENLSPKPANYVSIIAVNLGQEAAVADAASLEVGQATARPRPTGSARSVKRRLREKSGPEVVPAGLKAVQLGQLVL